LVFSVCFPSGFFHTPIFPFPALGPPSFSVLVPSPFSRDCPNVKTFVCRPFHGTRVLRDTFFSLLVPFNPLASTFPPLPPSPPQFFLAVAAPLTTPTFPPYPPPSFPLPLPPFCPPQQCAPFLAYTWKAGRRCFTLVFRHFFIPCFFFISSTILLTEYILLLRGLPLVLFRFYPFIFL